MPRLTWGDVGMRFYETGVDRGVLYVGDDSGVAWSGLSSIEESPSGGDARPFYLDGIKYLNLSSKEEFQGTINAFYSPPEFDVCDGLAQLHPGLYSSQQRRVPFGLSYRTKIGNDIDGDNHAYKIHIIYNALAQPTDHKYASTDNSPDAPLLAWAFTTRPILIPGGGYSAHIIIDTTEASAYALGVLENILYGDDDDFPRLPTPEELVAIFENPGPMVVTDNGDYTFTITGSGIAVMQISEDQYQVDSDTGVVLIDADSATISSE